MPGGAALTRPTKPKISAIYTKIVGPVSAAPPGIRGDGADANTGHYGHIL